VPERKTKMHLAGRDFPVTEVPILDRKETPSEYRLEDGTILRFSAPVTVVYRIDDQWDGEGNPLYLVKNGASINVVEAGDAVKKK